MSDLVIKLDKNKNIYFASDFHLGLTTFSKGQEILREKKIIKWLDSIESKATAIFLVGDIFDFWFEYKYVVPKGFIRFLGKISNLNDQGIPVYFFTGNHDLWMFDYFQEELGIKVFKKPIELIINDKSFFVGHGDGLGPGDNLYKILNNIFTNKITQWAFKWIHPDMGIGLAKRWSISSRNKKSGDEDVFLGDKEYLVQYCKKQEAEHHRDYYIFGHRHLPLEVDINEKSKYYNLGEWVNQFTFGEFDGNKFKLKTYQSKS